MELRVKCAIVFDINGLDLEGVKEDLKKYGEVFAVEDNILDEDEIPVKLIYLDTSLSKFYKLMSDYNCVSASYSPYVLFPMEKYGS